MSTIDPKHATVMTTGNVYYSNLPLSVIAPPTPEEVARRERATWNARVEARKAGKKLKKGVQDND